MGLFSSSSKKSYSTNQNETASTNLNVQGIDGDAQVLSATKSTINITDGVAIEKNAAITFRALDLSENISNAAFDLSGQAYGKALDFADKAGRNAMQYVFDAAQPETAAEQNYTKTGLIALGLLTAGYVFTRAK